jgi:ATP-binding cassette subfamily C (CFTR/MRP) protein 1
VSSGGASVVAKLIGDRQKLWADATQKRITSTGSMLRDINGLKMTGLSEVMGDLVQDERVRETKQMEAWAWIKVWQNVVGE